MKNALEVSHLTKDYGSFKLDDVSFTVPGGTIMGLIGENGAGKSTTIKCILNLVRRDGGEIQVLGLDNLADERVVRDEILDEFLAFIQDEEHAILLSSHITSDLEKVADYVTYLHRGRVAVSGAKDELLDTYGKLVCGRSELERVDPALLVGVRSGQFGCEALVKNRRAFARFHPELAVEPVSLEDIMVFTVKGDAR